MKCCCIVMQCFLLTFSHFYVKLNELVLWITEPIDLIYLVVTLYFYLLSTWCASKQFYSVYINSCEFVRSTALPNFQLLILFYLSYASGIQYVCAMILLLKTMLYLATDLMTFSTRKWVPYCYRAHKQTDAPYLSTLLWSIVVSKVDV